MRFTVWTFVGLGALGVVLWCAWRWYKKRPGGSAAINAVNREGLRPGIARLFTGMDGSSGESVPGTDFQPAGSLPPSTGVLSNPGGSVIRII